MLPATSSQNSTFYILWNGFELNALRLHMYIADVDYFDALRLHMHIADVDYFDALDYFKKTTSQPYNRLFYAFAMLSSIMLNPKPMFLILDFFVCFNFIRTSLS
jgi:hypothetical protein